MRAVIQRVSYARVSVNGEVVGSIGRGIMVLVGMQTKDNEQSISYLLDKIIHLRIFEDANEKMNLSLVDLSGELLIIPNFTLYGDARKGRRPGFSAAAPPEKAKELYIRVLELAKGLPVQVQSGIFQTDMKVELLNDGPVTILLDSDKTF